MNRCCKEVLQAFQDQLARTAETLLKAAGDKPFEEKSVMEKAMVRRAEVIVDVMGDLKKFATEHK